MSRKIAWKKSMVVALVGASLWGIANVAVAADVTNATTAATTNINVANAAAKAEFHNGGSVLGAHTSRNITVLPIDRAKFWKGQTFDFEVEAAASTQAAMTVTIGGVDAPKYFNKQAVVTQEAGHRIALMM